MQESDTEEPEAAAYVRGADIGLSEGFTPVFDLTTPSLSTETEANNFSPFAPQRITPVLVGADSSDAEIPPDDSGISDGMSGWSSSSTRFGGSARTSISDPISTGSGWSKWNRSAKDGNAAEEGQFNGYPDEPDLVYAYDDTDSLSTELAELYSYSEIGDFRLNKKSFGDFWCQWSAQGGHEDASTASSVCWSDVPTKQKDSFVEFLLEQCERSEASVRSAALAAVLYLLQGAFGHVAKDDIVSAARENAFKVYRLGAFQIFVQLLLLEAESARNFLRSPALSIADSREMRVICNIIYSMIELIQRADPMDSPRDEELRQALAEELGLPVFGKTIFLSHLLDLFMKYASNTAPHFPLKKLLLLIWKVILVSCGGMETVRLRKNEARSRAKLPLVTDDTLGVAKQLRCSSPPLSASDMLDGGKGRQGRPLGKYKSPPVKDVDSNMAFWFTNVSESDDPPSVDEEKDDKEDLEVKHIEHSNRRCDSHPEAFTTRPDTPCSKGLPWTPKIRQEEIDRFIHQSRDKFVGFALPEDTATLVGLPKPIEESIAIMRKYLYVSLSDVQIKKEEGISRYPMSQKDEGCVDSAVERVYQALLPTMGNHTIALLKVLLACSPTCKPKSESLNVITDVLPELMPITVVESVRMGIDTNRHKEIIVKAVSGIILLLLKHLIVNHVYQFETLSQHLVMANCMALILKFLNQNILGYVMARNEIPALNYPACCLLNEEDGIKDLDSLGTGDCLHSVSVCCWRNLHSCINLIRILNKLAKWKRSRVLVLVLFKSAAILKRALRIRHPVMQLYTLKALKLQSKFLGRQWRRLNMRTMSAIYEKVRHRLLDDWAYGNVPENEVKRVDCQIEERKLRMVLDVFNNRRYHEILRPNALYIQPGLEEFQPLDHTLAKALSMRLRIPDHFKTDYEGWLQREVLQSQIDWDKLVATNLL